MAESGGSTATTLRLRKVSDSLGHPQTRTVGPSADGYTPKSPSIVVLELGEVVFESRYGVSLGCLMWVVSSCGGGRSQAPVVTLIA